MRSKKVEKVYVDMQQVRWDPIIAKFEEYKLRK